MRKRCFILAVILAAGIGATRADEPLLRDGAYEVAVSLTLPHVENVDFKKSVTICVTEAAPGGNLGLTVLSSPDQNLFGHCPVKDVKHEGETFAFSYVCPGSNAPEAHALYVFSPDGFKGRINIKMGGKNMTMIEKQLGRRIGDCNAPKS